MHPETMQLMVKHLQRVYWPTAKVLDVGSYRLNVTYRTLAESQGWEYTGLDIRPGPNVDVVSDAPLSYPFPDGAFDIVISGAVMEHVTAVWLWVPELVRLLRPGGFLAVTCKYNYPLHYWPVDCWRILPDGMRCLFDATGALHDYAIEQGKVDTIGSAFKIGGQT